MTKPSQETPPVIYLVPDFQDGEHCYCWCDSPAPGEGMDPEEAVKYVRADQAGSDLIEAISSRPIGRIHVSNGGHSAQLFYKRSDVHPLGEGYHDIYAVPQTAIPYAFRGIVEALNVELEHRKGDERGNAPGHGHTVPGIWDSDNGQMAGKACAWCALWNLGKEMLGHGHSRGETARQTAQKSPLPSGNLRVMGDIELMEEGEAQPYSMALVITFRNAEDIRAAIKAGRCEFEFMETETDE